MRRPLVIGHRGASGHALENSLAAFRLAAAPGELHCDGVELDVRSTKDGILVVHHDARLPSGEEIAALPFDALASRPLADGSAIPTLAEALETLGHVEVFIEIKALPPELDGTLCELANAGTTRRHVHAFDHRVIARLRQRDPELSLGVLSCSYPVDPARPVLQAGAATLWQEADLIDQALIDRCADAGIPVIAWTVNEATEAARLTQLGVSGLCGNWPERLWTGVRSPGGG